MNNNVNNFLTSIAVYTISNIRACFRLLLPAALSLIALISPFQVQAEVEVNRYIIELESLMKQGVEMHQLYNFDNKLDKQRCDAEKSQLKRQAQDLLDRISGVDSIIPADLKQAARTVQNCIRCEQGNSTCDRTRELLERVKQSVLR